MSVVLDANLLVVLAVDAERGPLVEAKLRTWSINGETLVKDHGNSLDVITVFPHP